MARTTSISVPLAFLLLVNIIACGAGDVHIQDSTGTLVAISVTPSNPLMARNSSQQFIATGIYSDHTTRNITADATWDTSDVTIAVISNVPVSKGLASSSTAGSITITATYGGITGSTTVTITPATLISIAITPAQTDAPRGTSRQFTATGTFSDNTTQDVTASVTWSSSSMSVATISNAAGSKGLATAAATGATTITALSGTVSGTTTLTVTPATLVSISVTPANPSVARGMSRQFTATAIYTDNSTQDLTAAVTWSSSNAAVATVSNTAGSRGSATALAVGTATISAASGSISGSVTLTVTPATLASITITPLNPSIARGTSRQFTATGTYSDSTTQNLTDSVAWYSSNTAVAAISNAAGSKGLATSAATGATTITASSGTVSGSTTLTVTAATLVSIAVTPANPNIARGTSRQFIATGRYTDSSTQDLTTVATWSSSNTAAATISNAAGSKGLATSAATGATTITAASGSVSGTTTLTITAATLVSIAVTPVNPSAARGTSRQFTAMGTYTDSSTQDLTAAVTWSSSNTAVATISNAAGSKGSATALAVGTATISAASGSVSGSTALTVTPATLSSITITPVNPSVAPGAAQQFTALGTYSDATTQDLTATATWNSSNPAVASISNATGSKGLATAVASGSAAITAMSGSISGTAMLTVATGSSGNATIFWDAPTTNADGTVLTDLAGYRIYYGTSPGDYPSNIDVGNVTTYVFSNLAAGTYYLVITAYDTSGNESSYSNEISKTL
jgi:trimeric autotransporter adhesin